MPKSTYSAVRLRRAQRGMIDQLEPVIAEGFFQSCQNICDSVIFSQLVAALEAQDIEKAIQVLDIEPAAFRPYVAALERAWEAGGNLAVNTMPRLVKKNA